jgi:predicted ATP-dependent endonuclease of OLD family
MRLNKVHVQTYRSIVDSGEVDIEDGVTVVVGKNEQGKTSFLRGIRSFNLEQHFSPSDFPNHLRPQLEERQAAEIPIVTLTFSLDPIDRKTLLGIVNGIESSDALRSTKYYDNHYEYWLIDSAGREAPLQFAPPDIAAPTTKIKQAVEGLKSKMQVHGQRLPSFAANQERIEQITAAVLSGDLRNPAQLDDLIKTYKTSLKTLLATDQPVLDDITAATTELDGAVVTIQAAYKQDASQLLKQRIPNFILHSTTADNIPNEVNVADFVANPETVSKGMSNLCRAAGLSVQKISELAATNDTAHREAYEDHYKGTISGGLNEFWTQAEYNVHFRIDKEKLSVSISDGTYTQRIPPSDRSEGFQWYLSFYATLLNDVGMSNQSVMLLDNPGLELHMDGQRDIKRFLEVRVSLTSQVIYVTHSPAMIDAFNLQQVRRVELQGNQNGTKVKELVVAADGSDLLEPVRAAIGMSLVSSLVLNEWNILVEGAADKPIVEGIFYRHYSELQKRVIVNGSVSESKDAFLVHLYHRTGLPYIVLLDADSGGRELLQELSRCGIPKSKIINLRDVFKSPEHDFAIEDILSAEFYHKAVMAAYPANPVEQPTITGKKRAHVYNDLFRSLHNIGFNKRRVGEAAKELLAAGTEDEKTRDNLGLLSGALVDALKSQTTVSPSPIADTTVINTKG